MKIRGVLKSIKVLFMGKAPIASFEVQASPEELESLQGKELEITIKEYHKKRSLDANALLWECLGKIAAALRSDPWNVYLYMLEQYGQFEYVAVPTKGVERFKETWRTTKTIDEHDGMTELICFYGSSSYNSKEFGQLLDGVIDEMKQMEIPIPVTADIQARHGKARA